MDKKETFGAEIAKQIPIKEVYNDLAHPMLNTVGQTLQGATRIALAPVSALVWGFDKISEYLDIEIPKYFERKRVEKEKIVSPDPSIAVPLIEAMRYTSHKKELREMFINLLGASMNSDVVDEHPAFVEIIKQLSSDECKIIQYLYEGYKVTMIKLRIKKAGSEGEFDITPYFSDIGYITNCQYPQKFPEYLNNLRRLGLIEVYYDRVLTNETLYNNLKKSPAFPKVECDDNDQIIEARGMYEISEFGNKFCSVCID